MVEYDKYIARLMKVLPQLNLNTKCDREEYIKLMKKVFIEYTSKVINDNPRVGVGVVIKKDDKYLLLKRMGSLGENTWSFPGGKLDKFETIEDCAKREVKEETNLDIFNIKVDSSTNDIFKDDDVHYITIFVTCDFKGIPQIMESNKCSAIGWFDINNFPKELFPPLINYLKL